MRMIFRFLFVGIILLVFLSAVLLFQRGGNMLSVDRYTRTPTSEVTVTQTDTPVVVTETSTATLHPSSTLTETSTLYPTATLTSSSTPTKVATVSPTLTDTPQITVMTVTATPTWVHLTHTPTSTWGLVTSVPPDEELPPSGISMGWFFFWSAVCIVAMLAVIAYRLKRIISGD